MSENSGGPPSGLEQGAQAAGAVRSAVKLGKAVAGAAKGAAAGPYGMLIGAVVHSKLLRRGCLITLSLLLLPILFIIMLPLIIFGLIGNALFGGGDDNSTVIMNDDAAIYGNIIEVNDQLHIVIQEGLDDVIARIDRDFVAEGVDIKEISNPYAGSQVMNPLLIITQFCASKDEAIGEISLDNLTSIVRDAKGKLFSFEREIKTEMRPELVREFNVYTGQFEDVERMVEKQVAYYTIQYNGESYFADDVFFLTDEQKMLSNDYYDNLLVYLEDKADLFVGGSFDDLVGRYHFPYVPGGFATPLPAIEWRDHVSDEFGTRGGNHRGIDITAPYGTPIHAVKDGIVIAAEPWTNSWGIYVVINHGGGLVTLSAHMTKFEVCVGQEVKQSDIIGYVGMTGVTSGPHIHFEVQLDSVLQDPRGYLP